MFDRHGNNARAIITVKLFNGLLQFREETTLRLKYKYRFIVFQDLFWQF